MCGIAGIVCYNDKAAPFLQLIEKATSCLVSRGPDAGGIYRNERTALGHRRLSIIDTSSAGNQPMTDPSGRYTIIFNGEFFNYPEHRQKLQQDGIQFISSTDTEVLLHLFIKEGVGCLNKVNGFFSV